MEVLRKLDGSAALAAHADAIAALLKDSNTEVRATAEAVLKYNK